MQIVKDSWSQPVNGSPSYIWEEKLRRVKSALKCWAKTLPNAATQRKKLQSELDAHHLLSEEAYVSKENLDKEAQLQQQYHKA